MFHRRTTEDILNQVGMFSTVISSDESDLSPHSLLIPQLKLLNADFLASALQRLNYISIRHIAF